VPRSRRERRRSIASCVVEAVSLRE
jgi:hypothetical protein